MNRADSRLPKKHRRNILLLWFALVLAAPFAAADVISVAFKAHNPVLPNSPLISGPEPAATAADPLFGAANVWNNLFAPDYFNLNVNPAWNSLIDSTGAATGVNLSITGKVGAADLTPFIPNPDPLRSALLFWNSWSSGMFGHDPTESSTITWTLTGLAPNATFDMCIYGGISDSNRSFNMTIGGVTQSVPTFSSSNAPAPSCVLFSQITSDASGTISGIGAGVGDNSTAVNEANWSGFQLAQVPVGTPEPPSWTMIGPAALALRFIRRKRSTR